MYIIPQCALSGTWYVLAQVKAVPRSRLPASSAAWADSSAQNCVQMSLVVWMETDRVSYQEEKEIEV